MRVKVGADGLDELVARLRKVEDGPKLNAVLAPTQPEVARLVETDATSNARGRQMTKAVASNKYRANKGSVTITVGGTGSDRPWAVGAQFGAKRFRQFPAYRRDGYTVVPAIKDNADNIAGIYADAITAIIDP